jgi:hypothetical protein
VNTVVAIKDLLVVPVTGTSWNKDLLICPETIPLQLVDTLDIVLVSAVNPPFIVVMSVLNIVEVGVLGAGV